MALEDSLTTEARNPLSEGLDALSAGQIVSLMNDERRARVPPRRTKT